MPLRLLPYSMERAILFLEIHGKSEEISMTLDELKIGQDAILRTIGGEGELRHHLLDMGLTPGTEVTLRKVAPHGRPH